MYEYVSKEERQKLAQASEAIMKEVQKQVADYFTFEFRLIGSGERRLITRDGKNGPFDLDYNIIIQKDKKDLISHPDKIKEIFIKAFNLSSTKHNFKHASDSTSVITLKSVTNNVLHYTIDVAIMMQGNNGNFLKIIFDKPTNRYIWNEIPRTKDYMLRFKHLKTHNLFEKFKNRYLEKKNLHLSRNDDIKSFSIFLETLNTFNQ